MGVATRSPAIILWWPRVSRRISAPFVALLAATALAQLLHLPVETIGDRFGEIHASLPHPSLPNVSGALMGVLHEGLITLIADWLHRDFNKLLPPKH